MLSTYRRHFLGIAAWAAAFVATSRREVTFAAAPSTAIPVTLGKAQGVGQAAQFTVGLYQGIFARKGLDLTFQLFSSGAAMGPALVSGSLGIIADGDVPAIPIMAAGAPVKALCPISDFSSDQAIVANTSVKTPYDLLNKKIALLKGSVATLLMERYAAHYGLDLGRIHLINMPPAQQLAALAAREIDGYVCWEPFIWGGVQRIPGAHVLARGDAPNHLITVFDLLLVREDYLEAHQDAVKRLLRSMVEAMNFLVNASPSELTKAATYLRETNRISIPVTVLVGMMKRRRYTMTIDQAFLEAEKQNTLFLAKMGKIEHALSVDSWLDREPLRAVHPELVKA